MKTHHLKIKKGTQVSLNKIINIYKQLDWKSNLEQQTTNEINEFLNSNYGFWNEFINKNNAEVYSVTFSRTKDGLLYCIE